MDPMGLGKSSNEMEDFSKPWLITKGHMGVSENSVPLNPMVNDHYPY